MTLTMFKMFSMKVYKTSPAVDCDSKKKFIEDKLVDSLIYVTLSINDPSVMNLALNINLTLKASTFGNCFTHAREIFIFVPKDL